MIVDELKLYQRSEHFIWTDEYISKSMLAAHLDFGKDAASRNIKAIEKAIEWIIKRIPEGGKVLDLGCGPGLYTSSLAKRGYSVTGIDISQRSLAYARKKASEEGLAIDYYCADYINDDIGLGYDAVLCIYCDFGALTPAEQSVLLRKINCVLSDEGVFIFDVFKTGLCESKQETRNWHYSDEGGFWSDKPHFVLEEFKHFRDQKAWGSRTIIIQDGESPREYITWDNYYTEAGIKEVLNNNGFSTISINSELVAENEFTSNAVMFIESRKKTLDEYSV